MAKYHRKRLPVSFTKCPPQFISIQMLFKQQYNFKHFKVTHFARSMKIINFSIMITNYERPKELRQSKRHFAPFFQSLSICSSSVIAPSSLRLEVRRFSQCNHSLRLAGTNFKLENRLQTAFPYDVPSGFEWKERTKSMMLPNFRVRGVWKLNAWKSDETWRFDLNFRHFIRLMVRPFELKTLESPTSISIRPFVSERFWSESQPVPPGQRCP